MTDCEKPEGCEYFSIPLESGVCGGAYFSWNTSVFTWNTSVFTQYFSIQLKYFSIHLEYFSIHLEYFSIHFENTSVFALTYTAVFSIDTPLRKAMKSVFMGLSLRCSWRCHRWCVITNRRICCLQMGTASSRRCRRCPWMTSA